LTFFLQTFLDDSFYLEARFGPTCLDSSSS
jgi:hypothetical protein